MLRAFCDESGTHRGSPATLIAGFVGSTEAFDAAEKNWQAVLQAEGLPFFHYVAIENRKKPFEDCDEFKRKRVYAKLAGVIGDAVPGLRIVSAAYEGVWDSNISDAPHWAGRYPNPYAFCFEFLTEALNAWSERDLGGELILPVLAYQLEYGPPAESIYNLVAPTNSWPSLGPLTFGEPKDRPALQMADMLNYEMYKFLGGRETDAHLKRPLLSRLWADRETFERATLFNITHDERTLKRLIARGPLKWGPGYAGPPLSDAELRANGVRDD